jgi:hypothetical protein
MCSLIYIPPAGLWLCATVPSVQRHNIEQPGRASEDADVEKGRLVRLVCGPLPAGHIPLFRRLRGKFDLQAAFGRRAPALRPLQGSLRRNRRRAAIAS